MMAEIHSTIQLIFLENEINVYLLMGDDFDHATLKQLISQLKIINSLQNIFILDHRNKHQ